MGCVHSGSKDCSAVGLITTVKLRSDDSN
ncbi:hypothetical protein A2U01_0087990, partial [Trifolium medium]|nr:hypothetical protein [Trifolium medium]